jgi:5-methylcytosine-specific restriction endonuclease McrA
VIRVEFIEPTDAAWEAWIKKGKLERKTLEDNFTLKNIESNPDTRPSINENLYKEQKEALLRIFYGKCGYCESLITANQPGDVEHFRPKGRITDKEGKVVTKKFKDGKDRPHFAYFWLAYERENLFPACSACNRPTNLYGHKYGKWDKFPVRNFRASVPGEEVQEEALLLNPWTLDNTEKHFKFDDTGIVSGLTDEARMCIEMLGLNREGLVDSRKAVYKNARTTLFTLIEAIKLKATEAQNDEKKEIAAYESGKKPYSAIGRVAITVAKQEVLGNIT